MAPRAFDGRFKVGMRVRVLPEGANGVIVRAADRRGRFYVELDAGDGDDDWYGGDADPGGFYEPDEMRPLPSKRSAEMVVKSAFIKLVSNKKPLPVWTNEVEALVDYLKEKRGLPEHQAIELGRAYIYMRSGGMPRSAAYQALRRIAQAGDKLELPAVPPFSK